MVFLIYSFHSGGTLANQYAECAALLHDFLSRGHVMMSVVVVLEEQGLDDTVSGECDGRNAEAWEGALETVPPTEGTGIPPLFTVVA